MHIRRMQLSDLPRTATIAAESFKNDKFFNYICPRLHEYPEDFRAFFLRSQRQRMSQVGLVCYVAETDDSDPEEEKKVVGIAFWERVGDSKTARTWKKPNLGLVKAFERNLQYAEEVYFNVFVGDRSADKKRLSEFFASLKDNFLREIFQDYWYLQVLAIDPAYQRRGIGSLLTTWGVERAKEEGCCAVLEASIPGQPLYERLGFQVTKILPGDPSVGSAPVPVLVWQPKDSKEDWVGRARVLARREKSEDKAPQERGLSEKISDAVGVAQAESGAARV